MIKRLAVLAIGSMGLLGTTSARAAPWPAGPIDNGLPFLPQYQEYCGFTWSQAGAGFVASNCGGTTQNDGFMYSFDTANSTWYSNQNGTGWTANWVVSYTDPTGGEWGLVNPPSGTGNSCPWPSGYPYYLNYSNGRSYWEPLGNQCVNAIAASAAPNKSGSYVYAVPSNAPTTIVQWNPSTSGWVSTGWRAATAPLTALAVFPQHVSCDGSPSVWAIDSGHNLYFGERKQYFGCRAYGLTQAQSLGMLPSSACIGNVVSVTNDYILCGSDYVYGWNESSQRFTSTGLPDCRTSYDTDSGILGYGGASAPAPGNSLFCYANPGVTVGATVPYAVYEWTP